MAKGKTTTDSAGARLRDIGRERATSGESASECRITAEVARLKACFPGADESKMAALEGMFVQAAREQDYLNLLAEQARLSGLVKISPENASLQRSLPVSAEIARHSAALTNILDKLCKHLGAPVDLDDDELARFE